MHLAKGSAGALVALVVGLAIALEAGVTAPGEPLGSRVQADLVLRHLRQQRGDDGAVQVFGVLAAGLGDRLQVLRHQHADLVAVGDGHADASEPAGICADQADVRLGVVEPDIAVPLLLRHAVALGVLRAHREQRLDDAGDTDEGARATGGVQVAGMPVARALRRLGGVVHQHDRALAPAGDLAEHDRDRLDLLVAVLVDLVGLDERVDDEHADAVRLDVLDAGVDVGQPDHVAGTIRLGDQERTVGAAVEREPASDLGVTGCPSAAGPQQDDASARRRHPRCCRPRPWSAHAPDVR